MRKKYKISILVLFCFLLTACPDDGTITYETIKSVRTFLFSFDENGVFPHLEEFNREELGIAVVPDSTLRRTEYASTFSIGTKAYARSNPNEYISLNAIDSLNVITIYDFDDEHPAGSPINDLLLYLNDMGETAELPINELYSTFHIFKFSAIPQNDSLQFEVSGRITGEGVFTQKTTLVVLE